MISRVDTIVYGLMLGAFALLASGFCLDLHWTYTGIAFAVVAAISFMAVLIAWLNGPDNYDTRSGARGG